MKSVKKVHTMAVRRIFLPGGQLTIFRFVIASDRPYIYDYTLHT